MTLPATPATTEVTALRCMNCGRPITLHAAGKWVHANDEPYCDPYSASDVRIATPMPPERKTQ